jgi:hypothetical protein
MLNACKLTKVEVISIDVDKFCVLHSCDKLGVGFTCFSPDCKPSVADDQHFTSLTKAACEPVDVVSRCSITALDRHLKNPSIASYSFLQLSPCFVSHLDNIPWYLSFCLI